MPIGLLKGMLFRPCESAREWRAEWVNRLCLRIMSKCERKMDEGREREGSCIKNELEHKGNERMLTGDRIR